MSHLDMSIDSLTLEENAGKMADETVSSSKLDSTLTGKERQLYEVTRNEYLDKLDNSWKFVEELLPDVHNGTFDLIQIRQQERQLIQFYDDFKNHSVDFLTYLNSINTRESQAEIKMHGQVRKAHDRIIEQAKSMLDMQIQTLLETLSQKSPDHKTNKSQSSHNSSNSSIIARKKAQADAARARLEFASQEISMRKRHAELNEKTVMATAAAQRQKAYLEADMEFLRQQTEAAVAQAQFRAFEEHASGSQYSPHLESIQQIPEQKPFERTHQYVMDMHESSPVLQTHEGDITEPKFGLPDVNTMDLSNNFEPTRNIHQAEHGDNTNQIPQQASYYNPLFNFSPSSTEHRSK